MLLGDANDDGLVTGADLISVLQSFGNVGTNMQFGDANNDSLVTGLDLITVQENFGKALPAPNASLPEPSALAVLAVCCLGCIRR